MSPDLGEWLLRVFGAPGLAYPYVPEFAIPTAYVQRPSTLATYEVDQRELYLFNPVARTLLGDANDTRFAVSYWGHGLNSYAWTVLLHRPGLQLLAQIGFGGAFADSDQEARDLEALFGVVRDVDAEVPYGIRRDLVVLMSDIRGVGSTGWAPRDDVDLRTWEKAQSRSHPLLVVDDLVRHGESWPTRPEAPHRFASREERMSHEAQVTYEWARRFPEAADDDAHDPAADLALAQAMEPWPPHTEAHRWLPSTLTDPMCWWCFGDEDDELHR